MLSFGKYKNLLIEDVIKEDEGYLKWLNTQPWFKIKHKDLYIKLNILLMKKNKNNLNYKDCFVVYTDGACSMNGSENAVAGIGIHFNENNSLKIQDISKKLNIEKPTNNKAELYAIKEAIDICKINNIKNKIIIITDSD